MPKPIFRNLTPIRWDLPPRGYIAVASESLGQAWSPFRTTSMTRTIQRMLLDSQAVQQIALNPTL